jgi:cyclophilin family peptidyl-prolyl cis-trans isomerase
MRTIFKAPLLSLLIPAAALLVAGCGGDDDGDSEAPAGDAVTGGLAAAADEAEECQEAKAPEAKNVKLDRPKALKASSGVVTFATSCGTFTVRLDAEAAPKTSASFAYLAEEGVFDKTTFHRVAPSFVIQGGDPSGDGTGGPGYFVDERPPNDLAYTKGIVAMAKSPAEPPGRSGSQFFVVTAPADAGLPPDYALVGEVEDGYETVQRIEALGTVGSDGPPSQTALIEKATFTADG